MVARVVKDNDAWRIGVLFSKSGVTSVIERTQLNGVLLAAHEINEEGGVNGRPLEPVVYDPGSEAQRYGRLAERLLVQDDVNVLFGCYMSSSRKEVVPIVERYNGLLFYPTLYEGFEYSANVYYGGAAPNQNSVPLAIYLMENYGRRFYFIGSDYIYPRESNRVMRHIVREGQGEVIEEKYLPLDADENAYRTVIRDVRDKQPDVIFSTVVGDATAMLYRAYAEEGLDSQRMPIGSLTTSEAEIAAMGAEAGAGHITSAPYFSALDTESSRRFVQAYERLFHDQETVPITSCCEAAYFQVKILAHALKRAEKMETEALKRELGGAEYRAPQGIVKIDPDNNHTYLHARIGRVGPDGRFKIQTEVAKTIKPDPYLVYPRLNDWSFRLNRPSSQCNAI